MELKTLKDIEYIIKKQKASYCTKGTSASKHARNYGLKTVNEIRNEAIKWVKNERGYKNKYRDARADVLMEFHNITKEDLE